MTVRHAGVPTAWSPEYGRACRGRHGGLNGLA